MLSLNNFSRFIRGFNAFKTEYSFKETAADTLYDLSDYFTTKYDKMGENFLMDVTDEYLKMAYAGKEFLISRQTPSRQIWISSPISGSLKFDYDTEKKGWVDHKKPEVMIKTELSDELEAAFGKC